MFRVLFVLFIVIPIIEIAVLMQVGAILGAWPTVGIVIITAWLGAKNVRQQGLATMQSVQEKMARGEAPSDEIVAGFLLLIAGVLLITPGFVTDAFGLLLLVPQFRQLLIKNVQRHMSTQQGGNAHFSFHQSSHSGSHQSNPFESAQQQDIKKEPANLNKGNTIEGEFERKE
ncbi:MAG: FxsA family protein [Thalassotalea sp.]